MPNHPPPVPPAGRSDKGPGASPEAQNTSDLHPSERGAPLSNVDKQGQQGNSKVNTTHQGYQQDR